MSWHFSRALEAEYLAQNFSAGKRYALWRLIPSAQDDSCSAKMKDTFHHSPYGTMFAPLTDRRGAALLTWFREGFLAKTSVRQIPTLKESKEVEAVFGSKCIESFARFCLHSFLWKTHQCLWEEVLPWFSVILPKSGIMLDGIIFPQKMRARITRGKEFLSLPTPTTKGNQHFPSMEKWECCRNWIAFLNHLNGGAKSQPRQHRTQKDHQ
jgi:hypothetical protein